MLRLFPAVFVIAMIIASAVMAAGDQDLGSKSRRLELAKQMNDIRPARAQVDEAVEMVARGLGPMDKERLMRLVARGVDYKALEKKSIETMAEIFSVAELEKMVAYFGSPEAKAVERKLPQYNTVMKPEITGMLDKALMVEKTGGPGDKIDAQQTPEQVPVPTP